MNNEEPMYLSELCEFVAVQVDPAKRANDVYVGLEHVASGRFTRTGNGRGSDVQSSKYSFEPGDVLYGKLRPYLDKAVLARDAGVCTTELLVLRPRNGTDPRFLVSLLHSPQFMQHAVAGTTGVQHPRTSWGHISRFQIPTFDRAEQTRIANVLWQAHEAIVANEHVVEAGASLKSAAMRELFARGLRSSDQKQSEFGPVPSTWGIMPLERVAFVQTGVAKGRKLNGGDVLELPYLRVANVQDGHLDLAEMKTIQVRRSEVERFLLRNGDVVLTEGGDFDKLGRGFIWRSEVPSCVHQNHIFAVRTNRDFLSPEFLAYLVQSPYGKAYFLKVAHKTTNLACINTTKLKAMPVLLPSLDEQQDIVSVLSAIDRKLDVHRRKRAQLEDLFKTLLHKLMSGAIRLDAHASATGAT